MDIEAIKQRFTQVEPFLNERQRRLFVAAEAQVLGYGGISAVARATGVSRQTIASGLKELAAAEPVPSGRVRRPGGGRKRTVSRDASLLADLERLIEPVRAYPKTFVIGYNLLYQPFAMEEVWNGAAVCGR